MGGFMSVRRRVSYSLAIIMVAGWIATWIFGRTAVTRHAFETEIYREAAPFDRSAYTRISSLAESPPYPYYYVSTRSPFPFVIVADYGVMWGFTGGQGGRRIYLWLLGPIVSFSESHRWAS